ncbi:MAG: flavin prenyltransferase UbiX [Mariprofundales bacterium]|nr:flavin prenyltransferase UbiX [Mariprofundales bacterium]
MSSTTPITIAITGASGACYALRLIQRLAQQQQPMHLILSDAARVVLTQEINLTLPEDIGDTSKAIANQLHIDEKQINTYGLHDWMAPPASGSAGIQRMVIIPCSMGTLARIANGISNTLIERAADVILKERRQLIVVPRETPLSAIHLEHMLKLARLGVHILPAMPGFYHRPQSLDDLVDFIVERVLDTLGIATNHALRWGSQ